MTEIEMRNVEVMYFKSSGKYYTTSSFRVYAELPDYKIYEMMREWNKGLTGNSLPGLMSHIWNGYILVTPADGVPALLDFTDEQS